MDIVNSLISDDIFTIQNKLSGEAKAKVHEYLEKFGNRCINELKLESETLCDDPLPLYRAIGNYAVKLNSGGVQIFKDDFDEREIIKKAGIRKPVFKWILKNARRTIRNRENLRFERTRVFGTVRSIFKEIGMRLASFKIIDERDDIFYLELNETLAYIEGTATTYNLRGLVEVRKKEFAAFEKLTEDRFDTYDCVGLSRRHVKQADDTKTIGGALSGLGCCPGIVRGHARVITDPKGALILPGEILVAQRTDPGWIMLFPVAAGVLVEYGSLLSHAAIVVREMGIPAVVSVKNLLAGVQTGDLLELDGEKGSVTIIEKRN
jgi:pyruvate,water dikinase